MLLSVFVNNNMLFIIDVGVVINDYHHLRGGGDGAVVKKLHDSHVSRACNDCNGSTIFMNRKLKSDSNVLRIRIHVLRHIMKRKLNLHDRQEQVGRNSS